MPGHSQYTFDVLLQLKDAGLVAASAAATVAAAAQIVDVGAAECSGEIIIDITALETDTANEIFTIMLQGSNSATFASGIEGLAALRVGHATALAAGESTSTVGRYRVPFRNERNGVVYRYLRGYTIVAGTIVTGINYVARLAKT